MVLPPMGPLREDKYHQEDLVLLMYRLGRFLPPTALVLMGQTMEFLEVVLQVPKFNLI